MHSTHEQAQNSQLETTDKAKSLAELINLSNKLTHLSLRDLFNTPQKREYFAELLLTSINNFVEDQPALAIQITPIVRQLDKLLNNRGNEISYSYLQKITVNLPKLIIFGQLTHIHQLHQNFIAVNLELKNAHIRLEELERNTKNATYLIKEKISKEKRLCEDFYLKSLALYENLRNEIALSITIFPPSTEKNILLQVTNTLNDKSEDESKIDQSAIAYAKVKKTLLETLNEENDPTQKHCAAAFSIIEDDITYHVKVALAQLTAKSTAQSTHTFFHHILQLINLINQTLAINYQTTDDPDKNPQVHIAYKMLKAALRIAAKYAIGKFSDDEIILFIENRNQHFINQVAVMPLQNDGYIDNITAEFILEILESQVAKRYQDLKPTTQFHPQYPHEKNLISIEVQARGINFYFDDKTQDAFTSCMDSAEERLRYNASYARNIILEKSDLKRIKSAKTPSQFLGTLSKLTKMFVRDCQGDFATALNQFSQLLQLNPKISVQRKQAEKARSSRIRNFAQKDIESVIRFCNSHNFSELLNYLESYLPDENALTLRAVRCALTSLKRFLNHHFNVQTRNYSPSSPSEKFLQSMENIIRRSKSAKVVEIVGKKITTNTPSDSKRAIEVELQTVDRSSRESVDAAASKLYQFALFKRNSTSPRRSDDTHDLLKDTCHKFISAHQEENKDAAQLKLKAQCLQRIKNIVDAHQLDMSGQITISFFGAHNFQARGIAEFRSALKYFHYKDKTDEEVIIDKHFVNTLYNKITEMHKRTTDREKSYSATSYGCVQKERLASTQRAYNNIGAGIDACTLGIQREISRNTEKEDDVKLYDISLNTPPTLSPNSSPCNSRSTSPNRLY